MGLIRNIFPDLMSAHGQDRVMGEKQRGTLAILLQIRFHPIEEFPMPLHIPIDPNAIASRLGINQKMPLARVKRVASLGLTAGLLLRPVKIPELLVLIRIACVPIDPGKMIMVSHQEIKRRF